MASFKQETNKKWSVQFYYKDFTGKTQRKHKYGFNTKKGCKALDGGVYQERRRKYKYEL